MSWANWPKALPATYRGFDLRYHRDGGFAGLIVAEPHLGVLTPPGTRRLVSKVRPIALARAQGDGYAGMTDAEVEEREVALKLHDTCCCIDRWLDSQITDAREACK